MRRVLTLFLVAAPPIALVFACGGPGTPLAVATAPSYSTIGSTSTSASTSAPTSTAPSFGRARWAPIENDDWKVGDAIDLGAEGTLYAGDGGERWIAKGGALTAASVILPADLAGARALPDGDFAFVSRSGDAYETKGALGEPIAVHAAAAKLHDVVAGKGAFVGLDEGGEVVRSIDAAKTWSTVKTSIGAARIAELVLDHDGEGVALVAPQRTLVTHDDGASWSFVAAPSNGAVRLLRTAKDDIALTGLGKHVGTDGSVSTPLAYSIFHASPNRFEAIANAPVPEKIPIPDDEIYLDYMDAVSDGRGALAEGRYVEVSLQDGEGDQPLLLVSRTPGKAPARAPIPGLLGCVEQYVAAHGKSIAAVCVWSQEDKNGTETVATIARSDDGATTWHAIGKVPWNADAPLRKVWVTDAATIVLGACLPPRAPDCGATPLVRGVNDAAFVAVKSDVKGAYSIIGESSAGDRVAFAATVGDDPQLLLLESKDGGRSFTTRKLPAFANDDDAVADSFGALQVEATRTTLLAWAGARFFRYTIDATGKAVVDELASKVESVSLSGDHALALDDANVLWESPDRGTTWGRAISPKPRGTADNGLACDGDVCLLGARAFRLGWDFDHVADVPPAIAAKRTLAYAKTLRCDAAPGKSFGALEGVIADPGGDTAWVAYRRDPLAAAVTVVRKSHGAGDPVEMTLFPAVKGVFASAVLSRPEGVAALRYEVKPKAKKQSPKVEVAWWSPSDAKVHHATLDGAGTLDVAKFTVKEGKDGALRARASMWIAPGAGLFVRPYAVKGSEPLFFVSDAGAVTKMPTVSLPSVPITAFRAANASFFLGLAANESLGSRQLLVETSAPAAASSRWWDAWPAVESPAKARTSTTAVAGAPWITVEFPGDSQRAAFAFAAPIHVSGDDPSDAIALPTALDLGDPPRACPKTTAASGRVEIPRAIGARRAVVVKDGAKEIVLASDDTIARFFADATPACAGALLARPTSASSASSPAVVVDLGDLDHASWFTDESTKSGRTTTVHPLKCAVSNDPLPPALHDAADFSREGP